MLEKHYDHKAIEEKWYQAWEEAGLFRAEIDTQKEPYTVVIPPPNVTGMLHMGHVLNNTTQDIVIRYKKMKGFNTCWVPGTDHAGISTQNMVEKHLRKEGIDPETLSREAFLEKVWEWKEKFGGIIIKQLRKMGASCDWSRERFTMDDVCSRAVQESFKQLYDKGLIYRGFYIVNWCPALQTALSDDEVERDEVASHLWHFKYPLADSEEFLVVATTRPETMLGDTGVAVHPEDERYRHLIGRKVRLPIVGREIPIFADEHVDPAFGTGAVKVTPAHSLDDFEMAKSNDLPFLVVMDKTAHMNENVPEAFQGLYRTEARKAVVAEMDRLGLLLETKDHTVAVGRCYRTKDIIEPYLSQQWFIKMEGLAQRALEPVNNGEIVFYPERWVNTYNHWLQNIRDWCISRQLKWGHRIPVWHCESCSGQTCALVNPGVCQHCGSEKIEQDPDVLDTWASSWLWPFSVFGWPEKTPDLAYFYPTRSLVTAADIIFFWVARMIMAGQEFLGQIPFTEVCFNGIVRDAQGRKMSKTLGNSSDPLVVIDHYGADALRFTIVYLTPYGADARFADQDCERGRGFCTKIWNANRFLQMSFEGVSADPDWRQAPRDIVADWILSRLHATVQGLGEDLDGFRMAAAASRVYNFFWGEFCDWYVEFLKPAIQNADETEKSVLLGRTRYVVDCCLRMLHPFMPFVTEELWQNLEARPAGELLMGQAWPEVDPAWVNPEVEEAVAALQELISGIRAVRKSYGLSHNAKLNLYLFADQKRRQQLEEVGTMLTRLGGLEEYSFMAADTPPKGCSPLQVKGMGAYLDLRGHLDIQSEYDKIAKKLSKLEKERAGMEKRLANPHFRDKAPADVVAKVERERDELNRQIDNLIQSRTDLEKLEIHE